MARLPAEERIRRIRADRWIGYPRAVQTLTGTKHSMTGPANNACPTSC